MPKSEAEKLYYYYNGFKRVRKLKRAFNWSVGGRGCGKTYAHLFYQTLEAGRPFIYMRRTNIELEMLMGKATKERLNPFRTINQNNHTDLRIDQVSKKLGVILSGDTEHGAPKEWGYAMALTDVSGIRGFDASNVLDIVYDEFIPEEHKNKMRGEYNAFLNAYETISRNRELEGREPLYVYALSNANTIATPYFFESGLMTRVEKMVNKGTDFVDMPSMETTIELIPPGKFGEEKAKTVLYRFAKNSDFAKMALANQFAYNDFRNVETRPLQEYNPVATYGEIGIYQHKSDGSYYACEKLSSNAESFPKTDIGNKQFVLMWGRKLYRAIMRNQMYFENFSLKYQITELVV